MNASLPTAGTSMAMVEETRGLGRARAHAPESLAIFACAKRWPICVGSVDILYLGARALSWM